MLALIKMSVARLVSDRVDFKVREVIRDTEGHHMMMKRSALKEDITVLYVYAPNNSIKLHETKPNRTAGRHR